MRAIAALSLAALLSLLLSSGAVAADDIDELYKTRNCFACHRIDKDHLGPAFKRVAAKYANDQGAEATLVRKIREGSSGAWGPTPMPAQPQVTEADATALARWILQVK